MVGWAAPCHVMQTVSEVFPAELETFLLNEPDLECHVMFTMKILPVVVRIGGAMGLVMAAMVARGQEPGPKDGPSPNRGIELTIYKADFAMVSENRPVDLVGGRSRLVIDHISKMLDPNSILFDWPSGQRHPNVVSSTYDLGIGNGSSVLSRLNGQNVEFMWYGGEGKPGQVMEGRLEVPEDGNGFSIRTSEKLYINPPGTLVASSKTASSLPQLSVELDSPATGSTELGVSYLTRGMSWSADYVAKLSPNQKTVELECWATVVNNTGIPFPDAALILMAGSPNRKATSTIAIDPSTISGGTSSNGTVTLYSPNFNLGSMTSSDDRDTRAGLTSNTPRMTVGDLYAYKIPAHATIGIDQMNRVSVLGTRTVPVKRSYSIRIPTLTIDGYVDDGGGSRHTHVNAAVALNFVNNVASNLGIPLPGGSVRVYEKDEMGHERYTGADTIRDTAKQEHVALTLSDAFDVFGSYKVLKSERIAKHRIRKTVETYLHNEKKSAVEIRVVQNILNRWWPVSESLTSEKLDADTIQWVVAVKPGETKKLTFTVDMKD